jgi:hypothetical protein
MISISSSLSTNCIVQKLLWAPLSRCPQATNLTTLSRKLYNKNLVAQAYVLGTCCCKVFLRRFAFLQCKFGVSFIFRTLSFVRFFIFFQKCNLHAFFQNASFYARKRTFLCWNRRPMCVTLETKQPNALTLLCSNISYSPVTHVSL